MEDIFKQLQKDGKNSVDGLVKWIQDAKLVEGSKDGEAKARALFADVANPKNVEFDKFKDAINKLAGEQNKTYDELSKQLVDEGPKLLKTAISGGVAAIKDVFGGGSKK